MTPWNAAPPPTLPPPRPVERLRMALRGAAAVLWTAALLAIFLAARVLDRAGPALAAGPRPGLAPAVVGLWARGALRLLGLRVRLRGAPTDGPGALVANHGSWLDIVALQSVARASFVSKAEVSRWPVVGYLGRAIGTTFIERRSSEAGRQSAALHARLRRGDRLAIFPEGTSSDGTRVLPFKSALFGAFLAPGLPDALTVQPVTLVYAPAPVLPRAFYGWWGDMDFGAHLAAVLARSRGGEIHVTFHPPLRAADFPDRKSLARAAEAAVRAAHPGEG